MSHHFTVEEKIFTCTDCHKETNLWCSKCEACGLCGQNTKCKLINPTNLRVNDNDKHSTMKREQQKLIDWINCCTEGNVENIQKLLDLYRKDGESKSEESFVMNLRDGNGRCALHFIVQSGQLKAAKFIVKIAPKAVSVCDDNGVTPIFLSVSNPTSDLFYFLIREGADIRVHDKSGSSLLHHACHTNNLEIIKYLIEQKINFNETSELGSPLHFAIESHQYEVIAYLLSIPVDINLVDNRKCTPIILSCVIGDKKIIELLLKHFPNLQLTLDDNVTPLHILCDAGNIDGVKLFLSLPNIKELCNIQTTEHQLKPIQFAAGRKNREIIELLLSLTDLPTDATAETLIKESEESGIWNENAEPKKKTVSLEQQNKSEDLKREGNICFAKKDYEKAIEFYTESLKCNPYNEILFANRSLCYRLMKQYDLAMHDIDESIKLNSKWSKSHYRKGEIYFDQKDYIKAAQSFFDATQYESGNKDILLKLQEAIRLGKEACK